MAKRVRLALKVGRKRVEQKGAHTRRHKRPELLPIRRLVELPPLLPRQHLVREQAQVGAEERRVYLGQLLWVMLVEQQQQPLEPAHDVN